MSDTIVSVRPYIIGSTRTDFIVPAGGNPSTIFGANLLAWYKADTGLTKLGGGVPGNGDSVSAMIDNSGNSLTMSAPGTLCPILNTTGINGLPALNVVQGTAAGHMQTLETAVSLGGQALSIFIVCQLTASCASNGRLFCFLGSGDTADATSTTSVAAFSRDGATDAFMSFRNSVQETSQAISTGATVHIGHVYDGANALGGGARVIPYVNGTPGTPYTGAEATDTFAATGAFALWSQYTTGYGGGPVFGGDWLVAEVVIAKAAATSGQVSSLETYFTGRGF